MSNSTFIQKVMIAVLKGAGGEGVPEDKLIQDTREIVGQFTTMDAIKELIKEEKIGVKLEEGEIIIVKEKNKESE